MWTVVYRFATDLRENLGSRGTDGRTTMSDEPLRWRRLVETGGPNVGPTLRAGKRLHPEGVQTSFQRGQCIRSGRLLAVCIRRAAKRRRILRLFRGPRTRQESRVPPYRVRYLRELPLNKTKWQSQCDLSCEIFFNFSYCFRFSSMLRLIFCYACCFCSYIVNFCEQRSHCYTLVA